MPSSVLHRCPSCGYETDVSGSLDEFSKDPHCRQVSHPLINFAMLSLIQAIIQCGLSDSEGSLKMQDDLAALFMRQMSMEGVYQSTTMLPPAPSTPEPIQPAPPIAYSITQHYHHSSHLASSNPLLEEQPGSPDPEIPLGVPPEHVLMHHNIDPWSLFPSQLTLFKQAGPDQQSRLITLWQISPPGHSKQIAQKPGDRGIFNNERGVSSPLEGNGIVDIGGNNMEEDGPGGCDHQQAEPYVISGYESLAQRDCDMSARQTESQMPLDQQALAPPMPRVEPSTGSQYKPASDPAYQSREWWHHSDQQYAMENQYGAFQQMNQYGNSGLAQARGHWMEDEHML
jgi:hypothetical protein